MATVSGCEMMSKNDCSRFASKALMQLLTQCDQFCHFTSLSLLPAASRCFLQSLPQHFRPTQLAYLLISALVCIQSNTVPVCVCSCETRPAVLNSHSSPFIMVEENLASLEPENKQHPCKHAFFFFFFFITTIALCAHFLLQTTSLQIKYLL